MRADPLSTLILSPVKNIFHKLQEHEHVSDGKWDFSSPNRQHQTEFSCEVCYQGRPRQSGTNWFALCVHSAEVNATSRLFLRPSSSSSSSSHHLLCVTGSIFLFPKLTSFWWGKHYLTFCNTPQSVCLSWDPIKLLQLQLCFISSAVKTFSVCA